MSTIQSAKIQEALATGSDSDQYLTFILADEEYGVDILSVQEIKGWDGVTPIPNTPKYIRGVINLRGIIVPIVDLRMRFNIPSIDYGQTTVVIVVSVKAKALEGDEDGTEAKQPVERIVGLVVDAVSDVYNIDEKEVKPSPDFCASVDTAFVRGLATVDEKMVILLDLARLLEKREMAGADAADEKED